MAAFQGTQMGSELALQDDLVLFPGLDGEMVGWQEFLGNDSLGEYEEFTSLGTSGRVNEESIDIEGMDYQMADAFTGIGSQFISQQAIAGIDDDLDSLLGQPARQEEFEQGAELWQNEQASAGAALGQGFAPDFDFGNLEDNVVAAAYRAPQYLQYQPAVPTTTAAFSAVAPLAAFVSGDFGGAPSPWLMALPQNFAIPAPASPAAAALPVAAALPAAATRRATPPRAAAAAKQPWIAAGEKAVVKGDEVVLENRREKRGWGKGRNEGGYDVADPASLKRMENCRRKQQVIAEKQQEETQWASVCQAALDRIRRAGDDEAKARRLATGAQHLVPYVPRVQAAGATAGARTKWKSEEKKREQRFIAWHVAKNWAKLANITPPAIIADSSRNQLTADWERGLASLGLPADSTLYGSGPAKAKNVTGA
jgi:hypothetical protein